MTNGVKFGLSDHSLGREEKGVTFTIIKSGNKSGKLVASKGGLRWYPKWSSKTNYFINWAKLGPILEENGRKQK